MFNSYDYGLKEDNFFFKFKNNVFFGRQHRRELLEASGGFLLSL